MKKAKTDQVAPPRKCFCDQTDPTTQECETYGGHYESLYLPTSSSFMETRRAKSFRSSERKGTPRKQQGQVLEMTGSVDRNIDDATVPINVVNSLKNELTSTKRVCDELCDSIKPRKEN